MAFNVEERNALVGAAGPAIGTLVVGQADIDARLTDLANQIFEGDRSTAARWVGGGLALAGVVAFAAAIFTGIDDIMGMAAIAVGSMLITTGAAIMLEARSGNTTEA